MYTVLDEKIRPPQPLPVQTFLTFPLFWRATRSDIAATIPHARRIRAAEEVGFPLAGPVRIALLEEFEDGDMAWLCSYAPEALVAPLDLALSLADQTRRGQCELPSLRTAIVVLTSADDSPLTDDHRDQLWRAWGLPVFEQLRGADGAIIAKECEVHDGLHLAVPEEPTLRDRTDLEIVTGICECGAETPRVRRSALSGSTSANTASDPIRTRRASA